jgi:hypothetical protein
MLRRFAARRRRSSLSLLRFLSNQAYQEPDWFLAIRAGTESDFRRLLRIGANPPPVRNPGYIKMTRQVRSLLRSALKMCSAFIGGDRAKPSADIPEVFIHDPKAQGPQNLDDPFLDTKAQLRLGETIARAARREPPKLN